MSSNEHKYEITAIAPQHLDMVWDDVKGYVQLAIDRGQIKTHSVRDVFLECAAGKAVLWVVSTAERAYGIAIASIVEWPQLKTCHIRWCAGENFKYWVLDLFEHIKRWARMNEAPIVTAAGRRGWIRAVGMREEATYMFTEA